MIPPSLAAASSMVGSLGAIQVGSAPAIPDTAAAGQTLAAAGKLLELFRNADGQQMWMYIAVASLLFSALPAVLALATSFTRILLVLTFLRQALGIGPLPPDRILTALAFFLTLYTMSPVTSEMNREAVQPYMSGKIDVLSAVVRAGEPLRRFLVRHTRTDDLVFFSSLGRDVRPQSSDELGFTTLVPAFVVSELKTAFQIGVVILLPFLVIDLIVAITVTSVGISGVNPATLAIPFKLLLIVLVDGWRLVIESLVHSFS